MNMMLLLVVIGIPLISQGVASAMRRRFVEFSKDPMPYSGAEVAHMMLEGSGINNVEIMSTGGQLTDHYNPTNKTVNLSEVVHSARNVSAAAVAAHECGHAVQDATGYPFLIARSKMVPLLKISNMAVPVMAFGGAAITTLMRGSNLVAILFLAAIGLPALFAIVTLPVEFNASSRALKWMESSGLVVGEQHARAKKALFWAAMTYVIAALGSIAQVLYYAQMFLGGGRRRRF